MRKCEIGIIGMGFVGNAVYQKFKAYYNVLYFDKIQEKSNSSIHEIVSKSEIIFICLPTPMLINGSCDTTIVEGVISEIEALGFSKNIIIKSTVLPGTTDYLNNKYNSINIVNNPEFLRERNAVGDYNNQKRIILGGNTNQLTKIKKIFKIVFPTSTIVNVTTKEAEMIKYYLNTFLANKVSFANEMFRICEKLNIDYNNVLKNVIEDKRVGNSHLQVPGHDGKFGFGGACFPKDLSALIYFAKGLNVDTTILSSTQKKNLSIRN